jgi:glycosyltransferase involved in cell wall biosynthesis
MRENSLRILILTSVFYPECFPVIEHIALRLREEGHHVVVITGQPHYPHGVRFPGYRQWWPTRTDHKGIEVIRVPIVPRGSGSSLTLFFNYLSLLCSLTVFGPFMLRKRSFDLCFVYAVSPLLQALPAHFISWLKGMPVVTWIQDLWPQSLVFTGHITNPLLISLIQRPINWIYRHSTILVSSPGMMPHLPKWVQSSVQHVHNVYPAPDVHPSISVDQMLQRIADPDDCSIGSLALQMRALTQMKSTFSVLCAGTIGTVQCAELIHRAAEVLAKKPGMTKDGRPICFYLAGWGKMAQDLLDKIEQDPKLAQVCIMVGLIKDPAVMQAYYDQADVLLLGLKSDDRVLNAAIPGRTAAYLANQKPIIVASASDGPLRQLVVDDAKAGLGCDPDDEIGLLDHIQTFASMPLNKRLAYGKRGRVFFDKHFELKQGCKKLITLFEHIVTQRAERNE